MKKREPMFLLITQLILDPFSLSLLLATKEVNGLFFTFCHASTLVFITMDSLVARGGSITNNVHLSHLPPVFAFRAAYARKNTPAASKAVWRLPPRRIVEMQLE
jgi:hypothetical protein